MRISLNPSALRSAKWYEFAARFAFGGTVTVATGLLAKHYGPVFGGLFLALPAIFPASATLIEKHETERKRLAGINRTIRGRQAAAVDAQGSALGSLGLICFAVVVWKMLPGRNAGAVLLVATCAWFGASLLAWYVRKTHRLHPWRRLWR